MPRRRVRTVDVIRQRQAIERFLRAGHADRVRDLSRALGSIAPDGSGGTRKLEATFVDLLGHGVGGGRQISAKYAPDHLKKPAREIVYDVRKAATTTTIGERGARWAAKHSASRVKLISKEQKAALREAISIAQRAAIHPRALVKQISEIVPGLDKVRARQASKFWIDAVDSGMSLSEAKSAAMKFHDKLVRARAEVIARHEMTLAMNEGRKTVWEDMVDEEIVEEGEVTREWLTARDERVDDICKDLDGVRAGLNEDFPGGIHAPPDPHIQCRCDVLFDVE